VKSQATILGDYRKLNVASFRIITGPGEVLGKEAHDEAYKEAHDEALTVA
jgi:hypothetical protein